MDVGPEAERGVLEQRLGAHVAGHDDDRVAEVDPATLGVREVPVLQDLEQDVEHLRVGLLDLVQEHHGVALAADSLGQLAAFLEAHIAWRCAHQSADVVTLHELAHVDLDERVLTAEHELGDRLGQLGLAHAGGAQEDERADGPLGVLEPGTSTPDRTRDGVDGLLLPDDPLVQRVLHVQQSLRLLLGDARDRHARPHGDDLGDVLLAHHRGVLGLPGLPLAAQLVDGGSSGGLRVPELLGAVVLLVGDGRFLLLGDRAPAPSGRLAGRAVRNCGAAGPGWMPRR